MDSKIDLLAAAQNFSSKYIEEQFVEKLPIIRYFCMKCDDFPKFLVAKSQAIWSKKYRNSSRAHITQITASASLNRINRNKKHNWHFALTLEGRESGVNWSSTKFSMKVRLIDMS